MAGKELSPVPLQQVGNGLNAPTQRQHQHHLVIQDADPLRFRVGEDPDPKTREFASCLGDHHRYFAAAAQATPDFRKGFYRERPISGSDGDDDVEDDDDDDDDVDDNEDEVKRGDGGRNGNESSKNRGNGGVAAGAVTVAEPESAVYYSQYPQATEGSVPATKDVVMVAGMDNGGCGFSGRKDVSSSSSNTTESLRAVLSDPVTGALMDDAMILPCGHSFGAGGIEQVRQMKACCTCSEPVSEDLISPNLSLQVAVQAFRREENLRLSRSSKRKRDGSDQDKRSFSDSTLTDHPRGRNAQFPFAVADRVIIKGNKRTPPRFVGREAVVTTQCLNGWYVVKTLDNAESVKLQYRSLAKAPEDPLSKATSSKMVSNWL